MTVVFNLTGSQAHVGRASFLAGWPERSAAGRVARGAVIRLLPVTTKRDLCRSSGLICRRCIQFAGGSAGRRRPERGAVRSGRHYVFMRLVGQGQARFPVVKRGLARRNPARRIDGSNRGNDDIYTWHKTLLSSFLFEASHLGTAVVSVHTDTLPTTGLSARSLFVLICCRVKYISGP